MSQIKNRKNLILKSETLHTLSGTALDQVAGGQAVTLPPTTTRTLSPLCIPSKACTVIQ